MIWNAYQVFDPLLNLKQVLNWKETVLIERYYDERIKYDKCIFCNMNTIRNSGQVQGVLLKLCLTIHVYKHVLWMWDKLD